MVDVPASEEDLLRRYLVPFIPVSVQRPPRAANQAVVRWQPGAHAPARSAQQLTTNLLDDLGFGDPEPARLHVDNQSAIAVAMPPHGGS